MASFMAPSTPVGPTWMTPFPLTLPIAQPRDLGHIQNKNTESGSKTVTLLNRHLNCTRADEEGRLHERASEPLSNKCDLP